MCFKHPDFCGGDIHKEPHFFDHNESYVLGRKYYSSMYTDKKCDRPNTWYIDGTPQMHYMNKVASRFAEFYTDEERNNLKVQLTYCIILSCLPRGSEFYILHNNSLVNFTS